MARSWLKKLAIIPPVLLGAGALAYMVINKKPPEQSPVREETRHVRIIKPQKLDIIPYIRGFGSVNPALSWNATAQVSGRIVYVHPDFRQGAILPKGTEIIRISQKDYLLAIRQAEANILAAKAKLTELDVSAQNTRASLEIERSSLKLKEKDFGRKQALAKQGTIAAASLDKELRDLLAQRKRVLELENALKLNPVQIEAQKQVLAVNTAQLETARLNLERTHIRLPFDARIARVAVAITQFVGAGVPLGQADGVKTSEVNVQIAQSHIQHFFKAISNGDVKKGIAHGTLAKLSKKSGLYAIVRLRFEGEVIEWRGHIARISDTIDPKTRTVGVIVAVDNTYGKAVAGMKPPLVKGMFVEVELRAAPMHDKIVLPRANVNGDEVYIRGSDGRLQIRKIKTGLVQGGYVVIEAGINENDEVVVSDLSPAIPGMLLDGQIDNDLMRRIAALAAGKGTAK